MYLSFLARFDTVINRHKKPAGILMAIFAFAMFAFSDVIFKKLSVTYPIMVLGMYSGGISVALTLWAASANAGLRQSLKTRKPGLQLLRGVFLTLNFIFFFYGLSGLPLAQTFMINNIGPLIATLLAFILLRENLGLKRIICIACGFAGVLLILKPGGDIPVSLHALSILAGTVTWSLANIINRFIGDADTPVTFTLYGMCIPLIAQVAYNFHLGWVVPSLPDFAWLSLSGVFVFFGLMAVARAFSLIDVAIASKFQYTQTVWGVVLGYVFFADLPDLWTVLGGGVIIASAAALIYFESRTQAVIKATEDAASRA